MKRIKHSFTLLEVTLSIFLTGILLSVLWNLYHRWYRCYLEVQNVQQHTNETLLFYHRLQRLFNLFTAFSQHGNGQNLIFTTQEKYNGFPSLYLTYENEADFDPEFNLSVSSMLYVNRLQELCLITWSSQSKSRKEILLDHVKDYELCFFDAETKEWRVDWPETLSHEPIWIQCKLKRHSKTETFIFRLSQSQEPILFSEKSESTI